MKKEVVILQFPQGGAVRQVTGVVNADYVEAAAFFQNDAMRAEGIVGTKLYLASGRQLVVKGNVGQWQ